MEKKKVNNEAELYQERPEVRSELTTATPGSLSPEDVEALEPATAEALYSLAPKAKQSYAVAGAGLYTELTSKSLIKYTKEEYEKAVKIHERPDIKVFLLQDEKGYFFNDLSADEKAFIIALRVLLSDSTPGVRALVEAGRNANEDARAKLLLTGAVTIRPEAYDKVKNPNSVYDVEPTPEEKILIASDFTPSDGRIVVFERNTFLRDYLGIGTGGNQQKALAAMLQKLSAGKYARFFPTKSKKPLISEAPLIKYHAFRAPTRGGYATIYVLSMAPIFGAIWSPGYILYPSNNAEILGDILRGRGNTGALLDIYEEILKAAAMENQRQEIDQRKGVQVLTFDEADLLAKLATEAQIRERRKRFTSQLYDALGIFYKRGLFAEAVQPAGKDGKVKILFNRIASAATN